ARVDEPGKRGGGFVWPPERPPQAVIRRGLGGVVAPRRVAGRMEPHTATELLEPRQDSVESRVVEWESLNVGVDLSAHSAEIFDGAVELRDTRLDVVPRQGRHEAGESVRMATHELRHLVVGKPGESGRGCR